MSPSGNFSTESRGKGWIRQRAVRGCNAVDMAKPSKQHESRFFSIFFFHFRPPFSMVFAGSFLLNVIRFFSRFHFDFYGFEDATSLSFPESGAGWPVCSVQRTTSSEAVIRSLWCLGFYFLLFYLHYHALCHAFKPEQRNFHEKSNFSFQFFYMTLWLWSWFAAYFHESLLNLQVFFRFFFSIGELSRRIKFFLEKTRFRIKSRSDRV